MKDFIFKSDDLLDTWNKIEKEWLSREALQSKQLETIPTNIVENEDEYKITMFMPGYDKADINAELISSKGLKVSVKSDKKEEAPNHTYEFNRQEYEERYIYLSKPIDEKNIKAEYKAGILTLILPIDKKEVEARKISII